VYVILVVLGRVGGAGIWWFSLGVFFFTVLVLITIYGMLKGSLVI
jgi:hypothetical protein